MDIKEKLIRVSQSELVIGFYEGGFVRFYEQSLFGWLQFAAQHLELPSLKVFRRQVAKIGNKRVLYGGVLTPILARCGFYADELGIVRIPHTIDFQQWASWQYSHRQRFVANASVTPLSLMQLARPSRQQLNITKVSHDDAKRKAGSG